MRVEIRRRGTSRRRRRKISMRRMRRRRERKTSKAAGGGILKFYTDDSPGLKVGPTTVLVLSLVFMAIVCSLHIMGKFRSG